jgi:hypothetical protein
VGTRTAAVATSLLRSSNSAPASSSASQDRYGDCTTLSTLIGIAHSDPDFVYLHMAWDPTTGTCAGDLRRHRPEAADGGVEAEAGVAAAGGCLVAAEPGDGALDPTRAPHHLGR